MIEDIYYNEHYYLLFETMGNGKTHFFRYENNKGEFAYYPFLINPINDLGFNLEKDYYDIQGAYGYNGVISNSLNNSFIDEFYHVFEEFCYQNRIIAEFTRFHPFNENYRFSENHLSVIFDRFTVALNLNQPYEKIWSDEYSSKNRNMIRKAHKSGLVCEILNKPSIYQIDIFIDLYHQSMKMANAERYYYFDKEFFYNTFKLLSDSAFLFNIIEKNGSVVCSSIFFMYGDYFHYHLSGRKEHSDNSVNNFLLDEAVKYAQKCGAKLFHLGGGRSKAIDDSLLKFKANFSKTRLPFFIGKRIHDFSVYNAVVRQWQEKYPEKVEKYNNYLLKYRF